MPRGLRDKIAESVNISDKTFISHNIETVVVLYNNYKGFRKDIEYIYSEIVSHLRDEGLIFNK
jgi:predicted nucleic-acid-binding protein